MVLSLKDGSTIGQATQSGESVKDASALTVLQRVAEQKQWPLEIQNTQYGPLVNAIQGRINGQDNKYWIYYVNGEMAQVGAGDYIVQPGDQIEFRFEESIF